ncbi:hypothetical protein QBC38DRAFT_387626 [Podospora fimiseda]|uniref:Pentatricopeptide repeat-containing protein n=1 Tax=Podospora fimiseda TaxID=252190 RepID=A0AAN7BSX0_9PEZI|nr:hypothetical protein QBC38DRAFT_387626 [Podospora fimiseda]
MRISSRIDGSICGAILFWHRPASSTSWSAAIASLSSSSSRILPRRTLSTTRVLPIPFTKPLSRPQTNTAQAIETKPAEAPSQQQLPTEEILALVDPYDGEEIGTVEDYLRTTRDPYMRGYDEPKDAEVSVTLTKDQVEYPSDEEVIKAGEEEQWTLWELRFAVMKYLRLPTFLDDDLERIYEIYQRLPEPRMLYLTARQRHRLLHALGQPGRVKYRSMLRYFSVIGDAKDSGIPLTQAEWNCTLHFAAKYVHTVSEAENEAALKLWREMEIEAGVKADELTFNILFDTASKAGNFTLAEMIFREMEHRGIKYNRYHYVALIFFFGLKLETNGVRAAYRDMVLAGEIIDTVVLNAVISGLLRSNEDWAAINIYERMKQANPDLRELPVRTQLSDRAVNRVLQMFAKLGKKYPEGRPAFQKSALITPDFRTYDLLIKYFGVVQGDLDKVAKLINDMKAFEIPVHGAIFLSLFKSFAKHGGPYSAWTEQRLQTIWQAFLGALDGNAAGLEISLWMALWVLRAFAQCYIPQNNEDGNLKLYEVHHELKIRWNLDGDDQQAVIDHLAVIVRGRRLNVSVKNVSGNRWI